jgi:hypothetical protein
MGVGRVDGSSAYQMGPLMDNMETVQLGESRLSDVAKRLGLDLGSLLKANPQITNLQQLMPGQLINLPKNANAVPPGDAGQSTAVGPASGPKTPVGDPLAASAMKARMSAQAQNAQASHPDASAERWQREQAGQASIPDESSRAWQEHQDQVNGVSRPDEAAQAWQAEEDERLGWKQKLTDLGLPSDPPKVTANDLDHLEPEGAVPDKEAIEKAHERTEDLKKEAKVDVAGHAITHAGEKALHKVTEKAVKTAEEMGEHGAAGTIEKIGSAGKLVGKTFSRAATVALVVNTVLDEIQNHVDAGHAREMATIEMHGATLNSANQIINQKFPQRRPLNDRGIQQQKAVFNNWKAGIDQKLDPILSQIQTLQSRQIDTVANWPDPKSIGKIKQQFNQEIVKLKGQLEEVLKQGTVDLANGQMGVFYDPRNWDESSMGRGLKS